MNPKAKITKAELDELLDSLDVVDEERQDAVNAAHRLMGQCDQLLAEIGPLRAFYKIAAKIECEGKCGKFQPVLQDSEYGSRTRNGEWLCPPCHSKVCGVDVTLEKHRWHSCQALR